MKSFAYYAVITQGECVCLDCFKGDVDSPEVTPLFADSEWDTYPTCVYCMAEQDYVKLTSDGMRWRSRRHWSAKVREMLAAHLGDALPRYTMLGSYPLFYMDKRGCVVCPKCANDTTEQIELVDADVHWEGALLECGVCCDGIESAYGDPETKQEEAK